MAADTFGNLLAVTSGLCGCFLFGIMVASLLWIFVDAQARGKTGCLWVLIAFFTWPLGVLAYLILRHTRVRL